MFVHNLFPNQLARFATETSADFRRATPRVQVDILLLGILWFMHLAARSSPSPFVLSVSRMDHKIFQYGLIKGTRGFSSLNNDKCRVPYTQRYYRLCAKRRRAVPRSATVAVAPFDIEKQHIQHISTKSGFEVPDLLRNDSQRADNAIDRETSAELRVPSDNTIRTSAQVSQPSSIEEMEQRVEACLRENRTSPYELAELCEMFPGHAPKNLCRMWYQVKERLNRKNLNAMSSLRGSASCKTIQRMGQKVDETSIFVRQ
ncbi:hypothetical protein BKA60DRAFT_588580 [Fusarium oxysporum]|nr:hypothetical protein BKA60DRAFT_588580 [Fusarium oxysporum]